MAPSPSSAREYRGNIWCKEGKVFMKYSEEGLQYHIHTRKGDVGRCVILPGDPNVAKIAEHFEDAQTSSGQPQYVTYTGYLDGEKSQCDINRNWWTISYHRLEELVRSGADTFVRVGTCGGIDIDVKGGDIVDCDRCDSVQKEQHSEYAPIEFPSDYKL